MTKRKWLISALAIILLSGSWLIYQKLTDTTYEGMTIIPEQHDDIPLYNGLEPTEYDYIIKGDHWKDIYKFYINELPKYGWEVEYEGSALDDDDMENDWGGFMSRWEKDTVDFELWISSHYDQIEEQTRVMFDRRSVHTSTTWINNPPEIICIYKYSTVTTCTTKLMKPEQEFFGFTDL